MRLKNTLAVALTTVLTAVGCAAVGHIGGNDIVSSGGAVHLTVGYQPYYTEAWSGVVMRGKEFWKKYLPSGSTVDFQVGLQGSIVVSQLLAGKQQIGYVGDMPSIVGVSKRSTRDLRIVATLGLSEDQCGVFLVRPDAPNFANQRDALAWFNGKTVATPQGSCTDRIAQATFGALGIKPAAYLNQSIEVITSSFQNHTIDAAIVWEPVPSKLINTGLAKRVGSGALNDQHDGGFLVMDKEFTDKHPDIARSWLKAELDAQRYLADPANAADEIVRIAQSQTEGYSAADLRDSLYRRWPVDQGGSAGGIRLRLPFAPTGESADLIKTATDFLYRIKAIPVSTLPDGAVQPDAATAVLRDAGANPAVGAGFVRAQ
ncbi:ABC transporter substrate-binding protein [Mycobacterium colombiense]|uniref:ABC transporter substrate-binding protein n=1 Tax=Mycobacterium colombiense TaxID=339268 RepID=UPI00096E4D50|nr:ABC transporter substrate-binding protein [Mycobacterium colombiense]OMC25414.1 nitrate ABC transporter substrate-binding protein [Mycobacterium colombiense]